MMKKLQFLLIFVLFASLSFGQNKLWTKVSVEKLGSHEKMERASVPTVYEIMHSGNVLFSSLNAFKNYCKFS